MSPSPELIAKLSGRVSRNVLISAIRASAASASATIADTGIGVGEGVGLADPAEFEFALLFCAATAGGSKPTAKRQEKPNKTLKRKTRLFSIVQIT